MHNAINHWWPFWTVCTVASIPKSQLCTSPPISDSHLLFRMFESLGKCLQLFPTFPQNMYVSYT